MNVKDALYARRSIRGYKPDPVDAGILSEILAAAERAPSWANSQPWQVFVAQGETLGRIRAAYLQNYRDKAPVKPDIERPTKWTEDALRRQKALYPDMVRDCGKDVEQFGPLNNSLFGAPVVLYVCVDRMLSPWSLFDLGAYCQSVMLLAVEYGLSTIPAITTVNFPEVLHRELGIPEHLAVAIGIAMGYADPSNGINNFKSARDELGGVVTYSD